MGWSTSGTYPGRKSVPGVADLESQTVSTLFLQG